MIYVDNLLVAISPSDLNLGNLNEFSSLRLHIVQELVLEMVIWQANIQRIS